MKFLIFILFIASLCFAKVDPNASVDNILCAAVDSGEKCNPGFENGLAGWTSSGTPTTYEITTTAAQVANGKNALSYDPDADGEYVELEAITVPPGMYSRNGVVCIRYSGSDENIELNVLDGSSNELASEAFSAHTGYSELCVNFIFPSSGTIKLRLEAEGDAAAGFYDDAFLGDANRVNISKVSSAELWGSAKWVGTANCTWTDADTGSWQTFAADADCTSPTGASLINHAEAPSTKIPAIKFTNLPPGRYQIVAEGYFGVYDASATSVQAHFRFHDGTNATTSVSTRTRADGNGANDLMSVIGTVIGELNYETTQSSIEIAIQGFIQGGDTIQINAATADQIELKISVYRYPLSSETAYTANTENTFGKVTIAGHADHAYSSASATWATMTDTDIIAGDKSHEGTAVITSTAGDFGIKMPRLNVGWHRIHAQGEFRTYIAAGTATCQYTIYDGTSRIGTSSALVVADALRNSLGSLTGYIYYDSVQTDIEFVVQAQMGDGAGGACQGILNLADSMFTMTVEPVTQGVVPPVILNMVESSASGGDILCRAKLNCDAASAITSQSGSCVASIGNIAAGVCVVTLTSGVYGETPECSCELKGATLDENSRADATSVTNVNLYGIKPSDGSALTSYDCSLKCTGDKN